MKGTEKEKPAEKPTEKKAKVMHTVRIRNAGMIKHKAFGAKPYRAVFNEPTKLTDDQVAALDELGIKYRTEAVAPEEEARDAPSKKSEG